LRKYLFSIFCMSFMMARGSECKNCPHKLGYRKLDIMAIASQGQKYGIFPEFIDWLRDEEIRFQAFPACTKNELQSTLSIIKFRHLPPIGKATATALGTTLISEFKGE
jgi:hypothetical protein